MTVPAGSLLAGLPQGHTDDEIFATLARSGATRFERIVSTGQASPAGFWYDESWDEFVVVVAGGARLELAGEPLRELKAGDWIFLPAHTRHRVAWTDPDQPTVWLNIHVDEPSLR